MFQWLMYKLILKQRLIKLWIVQTQRCRQFSKSILVTNDLHQRNIFIQWWKRKRFSNLCCKGAWPMEYFKHRTKQSSPTWQHTINNWIYSFKSSYKYYVLCGLFSLEKIFFVFWKQITPFIPYMVRKEG